MFSKCAKSFVLIAISFVSVACSTPSEGKSSSNPVKQTVSYSAQYQGAAKDWAAQLSIKALNGNEGDKITLSYIGSDRKAVGKIKAMFQLPGGSSMGGTQSLSPNGFCTFEAGGTTAAPPPEGTVGKATVEWNEKKETFDLIAK